MFMFFWSKSKKLKTDKSVLPDIKHHGNPIDKDEEEVELLRLKYEKLQYIEEKEKERDKTVENKASMFIGSTSIMGAIIIGCANLVLDSSKAYSYVNLCILSFMMILIYCLGRSITYSVLTLRKRKFFYLGIDDLQNTTNKKDYYTKLITSTIKIIKHNQEVINSKVDYMQVAQESFVNFWIWSGVFFVNLLAYHVFHAYGVGISWNTLLWVLATLMLSVVGYLVVANMVDRLKSTEMDEHMPEADDEIRAVCMMAVSVEDKKLTQSTVNRDCDEIAGK